MPVRIKTTDLVYFPVPKNACTSIKFALLNYNENGMAHQMPIRTRFGIKLRQVHQFYPSTPFRAWYPLFYASRRWLCVVRDPIRRFLSAYANRVIHHGDLKCSGLRTGASSDLSLEPGLDEFVERFEVYFRKVPAIKHHFRPMSDYLGTVPSRFYRVFTLSDLDELVALCTESGAPIELPHLQTGGPVISTGELTEKHRRKLLSIYSEDFAVWSSFFDR